jgi:fibronectin type 3 domain-containing protein
VFAELGQRPLIDLSWSPNSEKDLAGYNVYRRTESTQPLKINTAPVKTPAFQDANVQPGTKYFYSVSAVDLRGNESGRSPEAAETVPQQ